MSILRWKVVCACALISIIQYSDLAEANGGGWGSGGDSSNNNFQSQPAPAADTNYWWNTNPSPFQKPANHPGLQRGADSQPSSNSYGGGNTGVNPGPGWSSGNAGGAGGQPYPNPNPQVSNYNKPQSQPIPQNSNPTPNQIPVSPPIQSNPGYVTKPQPQVEQSLPTNPYGSQQSPPSQGSGWSAPPSNVPVQKPYQNYEPPPPSPPQPIPNTECQLKNKNDCHGGGPAPVINSGYDQVDSQQLGPNGYPSSNNQPQPQQVPALQVPVSSSGGDSYGSPINQSPVQSQPAPAPAPAIIPQVVQQPAPSYQQQQPIQPAYQQQQQTTYTNPPSPPVIQQQPQPVKPIQNNPYNNNIQQPPVVPASPPIPSYQQQQPSPPVNSYNPSPSKPNYNYNPAQNYQPAPQSPPAYNNNNNNDISAVPFPGCPAALLCVPESQCDANGVAHESQVRLTEAEKLYRVALMACSAPETGIVGVCCRDPNYKDPWPGGVGGGDHQHHHHDQGGQSQFNNGQYTPQQHQQPSNNFNTQYSARNTVRRTVRPTMTRLPTFAKCQSDREECVESFNCIRGYIKSTADNLAMDFDIRFNPKPKKCKEDFDGTYFVCCKKRPQESQPYILVSHQTTTNNGTDEKLFLVSNNNSNPNGESLQPVYQNNLFLQNTRANTNKNTETTFITHHSSGFQQIQTDPDNLERHELDLSSNNNNNNNSNGEKIPQTSTIDTTKSFTIPENKERIRLRLTHSVISISPTIAVETETITTGENNEDSELSLSPQIYSKTEQFANVAAVSESDSEQTLNKQQSPSSSSLLFGLNQSENQQASGSRDEEITTPYYDTSNNNNNNNNNFVKSEQNQRPNHKNDAPLVTDYKTSTSNGQRELLFNQNERNNGIVTITDSPDLSTQNFKEKDITTVTVTEGISTNNDEKNTELMNNNNNNNDDVVIPTTSITTTTTSFQYKARDDENRNFTHNLHQQNNTLHVNTFHSPSPTTVSSTTTTSEMDEISTTEKIKRKDSSLYPFFQGIHRHSQYVTSETGEKIKVPSQFYEPPSLTPQDLLQLILPPEQFDTTENDNTNNNNETTSEVDVGEIQLFSPLASGNRHKILDECPSNMKCLSEAYCATLNPEDGDLDAFDIRLQFRKRKAPRQKCRQPNLPIDGFCCFLRDDFQTMHPKNPQKVENQNPKPKYDERCGVRRPPVSTSQDKSATSFGEFPWTALILKNDYQPICGGVILNKRVIATTATCIQNARLDDIIIRVGEWDTENNQETKSHQDLAPKIILRHPGFKSINSNLVHDIALIVTNEKIAFDYHVSQICIPEPIETNFEDQRCIVTGWASKEVKENTNSTTLEQVSLPIISHGMCEKELKKNMNDPGFSLHRTSLCTGNEPNVESCTAGLLGNPIVCSTNNGGYTLVGLASWEKECQQPLIPRVFTNIPNHTEWIYRILGKDPDEF